MQYLKPILTLVLILAHVHAMAVRTVAPEDGVAHAPLVGPATAPEVDATVTATTTVRVTVTVSSASAPAPPHSATPTTAPRPASSSRALDPTTSAPRPDTTVHASTSAAETTARGSTRVSVRPGPSPLDDSSSAAATPPSATSQVVPPNDPVSSAPGTGASVSGAPASVSGVPASGSARPTGSGSVSFPLPLSSGLSSLHASGASSTLTVSSASAVLFTPNPTVTGGTLPSGSTFRDNGAAPRVRAGGVSAVGVTVAVAVAVAVAMGGGMVGWGM
ncbi:hypothetical protein V8D89_000674 [Ganoderma adspersum]